MPCHGVFKHLWQELTRMLLVQPKEIMKKFLKECFGLEIKSHADEGPLTAYKVWSHRRSSDGLHCSGRGNLKGKQVTSKS